MGIDIAQPSAGGLAALGACHVRPTTFDCVGTRHHHARARILCSSEASLRTWRTPVRTIPPLVRPRRDAIKPRNIWWRVLGEARCGRRFQGEAQAKPRSSPGGVREPWPPRELLGKPREAPRTSSARLLGPRMCKLQCVFASSPLRSMSENEARMHARAQVCV